ncbi:MAG: hypothetical protein JWN25_3433 [Verrucomicrobiales bacterium]|nr:hypothetical protein [Verrucomicrobiales bacterium]
MNKCLFYSAAVLGLAASLQSLSAADLVGKVTLKGTAPAELAMTTVNADKVCGKMHDQPVFTRHYVVGQGSGLGNVFVYVTAGVDAKSVPPAAEKAPEILDQKGCLYYPYVMGIRTGQKLTIKNSDPVLHNVHSQPKENKEFNFAQPLQNQESEKSFTVPEVLVKMKCDVHNWMFAYIGVVDHPYFAVTDKDGNFKISGLPPGKYTVEAVHMKAGKKSAEVTMAADGGKAAFELEAPAAAK